MSSSSSSSSSITKKVMNNNEEKEERGHFEFYGWVYHLGVNSIGHEYCHLRFLFVRGKYVEMYKRDPREFPGIKPIRRGVVSSTLMVEELGRKKVNNGDLYVIRFYNRLDETKKGEIACATAGEARKWMEAFDHAKQQAEYELSKAASRHRKLSMENELNLEHQPRVRRYAHGLRKLIKIGQEHLDFKFCPESPNLGKTQYSYSGNESSFFSTCASCATQVGPESLLRQSSDLGRNVRPGGYFEAEVGDVIEAHEWKCARAVNGIRIFEDVADMKNSKSILVKSVGVVDASLDTVFEVVLSLDRRQRYEWDMFIGDLELVDSLNGHYDVVYGTYDPKYLTRLEVLVLFARRHSRKKPRTKQFNYLWARAVVIWVSSEVKGWPWVHECLIKAFVFLVEPKFRPFSFTLVICRLKYLTSTWEIRSLSALPGSNVPRCLVTLMLEMESSGWFRWKNNRSHFEKTIHYALLCQVAGLREFFGANPTLIVDSPTTIVSKFSNASTANGEFEDSEVNEEFYDADQKTNEEFYDAIAADELSEDEDSESDSESGKMDGKVTLKNVSWAIASLALKKHLAPVANNELEAHISPISVDANQFNGSMHQAKNENDTNCWTSPGGQEFMVMGGEPLLKLLAVDWFKAENCIDRVAMHPRSLVQYWVVGYETRISLIVLSEAGKKLPFILIINLEVPAKPYYSLVMYYGADRPIKKGSLLGRFVDGTDMFRDARFKLIPRIVEGYWMVKRAVGTKACLLGKAVTCNYFRQDNFLEIDVDIGSSSVAKSIISLVLGYVTSLVVDLAILIEAKEEAELPEYILGTVRLNRVKPDTAVQLEV
ncbi:hypothetical protein IFM89_018552 [Coptis chinensis]|uniref:Protein ENHANCED DISEASE RESISTANCE 2 C-terminal domain-containing protein n=1 Tax=Coptis chinensis TaxID=261450 RepID=A0A835M2W2_9MAGN|nr:hypothetical protein IFM89_018552 [Coptis chinensis]